MRAARLLFYAAAAWNWGVGLLFLFAEQKLHDLFGVPITLNTVTGQIVLEFVLVLGLGYAWVARDPTRNHGLVGMAAIGKTGFVAILFAHAIAGTFPLTVPLLLSPELVFAALFVWFLARTPRRESAT